MGAMQLVRGLILLNATPFWTVYSLPALAPLGLATVPVPPAAAKFVRKTLFGYLSNPSTISTVLKQVPSPRTPPRGPHHAAHSLLTCTTMLYRAATARHNRRNALSTCITRPLYVCDRACMWPGSVVLHACGAPTHASTAMSGVRPDSMHTGGVRAGDPIACVAAVGICTLERGPGPASGAARGGLAAHLVHMRPSKALS